MRTNLPVTQRSYTFPESETLLSTTDTDSRITYANASFVRTSGFELSDLVGQPHNIVRHPDMPVEAFADMWACLKAGYSWTALVKNRRSDGDHYWVRANAAPMIRKGTLAGYLSVRTKPSEAEVQGAEDLYRRFREGKAGGLAFHRGLIIRTGLMRWANAHKLLPTAWRIRLVSNAGSTMSDVVQQVERVSQLISEITAASKEQALGIGQVGQAVSQLDEMTQQNAAMVEQSSAAATA